MAANNRFEISSSGPDGVQFGYSGTHRSHFSGGPNLERVSSFRDSHDSRLVIQGAGGNFPGSSGLSHGELQPLSQVLSLEVVSSGEQKISRQLELRRAINAAVGMSGEDQMHGSVPSKSLEQQAPEELKRVRARRARERSRMLSEAMLKLEKYRASTHNRKRVCPDAFVHERPIASLPVERSTGGSLKASFGASPNHANVADSGTPKPEDKNKGVVPNRRVRTSLVDVRPEGRSNNAGFQRSSGLADRDRDQDSFKSSSSLGGSTEDKDRVIPNASEGWEKTKMKGRRSGTKSESVIVSPANGPLEAERESKWGGQIRNNSENRSRPSEGHGFR